MQGSIPLGVNVIGWPMVVALFVTGVVLLIRQRRAKARASGARMPPRVGPYSHAGDRVELTVPPLPPLGVPRSGVRVIV